MWSKGGVVKRGVVKGRCGQERCGQERCGQERCGCKRGVVKFFCPPPTLELWAHQEMVDGSPGHMLTVKYVQPFQRPAPPRGDITRVVM